MAAAIRVDWDAIEPHYRAGIRSLRDIGAEFEASNAAILKHAKRHGWARNLLGKVQAKADAKVTEAMVTSKVTSERTLTEAARVEVEAEIQARIRIEHRKDIGRARAIGMKLLVEMEHQCDNPEAYARLADLLAPEPDPDDSAAAQARARRLRDAFERALSLGDRATTAKALVESLKTLVALERQAFGIDDKPPEDNGYEAMLRRLMEAPA